MRHRLLTLVLVTLAAAGLLALNARPQQIQLITDYRHYSGNEFKPVHTPAEIRGWPLTTSVVHREKVFVFGYHTLPIHRLEPRPPLLIFTLNALVCLVLLAAFTLVTEALLSTFVYREKPKIES